MPDPPALPPGLQHPASFTPMGLLGRWLPDARAFLTGRVAPAVRSSATYGSAATEASSIVPLPNVANGSAADWQAGDAVYVAYELTATTGAVTVPAGWAEAVPQFRSLSSASSLHGVLRRIMQAGDAGITTLTVAHTNGRFAAVSVAVQNPDTDHPEDTYATDPNPSSAYPAVEVPGITPVVDNGLLLAFAACRNGTNAATTTFTPPPGLTEFGDATSNVAAISNAAVEGSSVALTSAAVVPGANATATSSSGTTINAMGSVIIVRGAVTGGATQGAATLAAAGSLSAPAEQDAVATLAGGGSLSAAGTQGSSGTLSGQGSITGPASAQSAPATLAAAGSITNAGMQLAVAALAGTGTLAATGIQLAPASLSAAGSISAAAIQTAPATLAAAGSLGNAAIQLAPAALAGTGSITGSVAGSTQGSASLGGTGSLSAPAAVQLAPASLAGSGSLVAAGSVMPPALLAGAGLITGAASAGSSALLAGTGVLQAAGTVISQGDTGQVTWIAGAIPLRWAVRPADIRWAAGAAPLRWRPVPWPFRWQAEPAGLRWRIVMADYDPIWSGSLENVPMQWTSDLAGTRIDPTNPLLAVQMAFPVTGVSPVSGDWKAAAWVSGTTSKGFISVCLVGPGGAVTLAAGKYDVWGKVLGAPEQPGKKAGTITVF